MKTYLAIIGASFYCFMAESNKKAIDHCKQKGINFHLCIVPKDDSPLIFVDSGL